MTKLTLLVFAAVGCLVAIVACGGAGELEESPRPKSATVATTPSELTSITPAQLAAIGVELLPTDIVPATSEGEARDAATSWNGQPVREAVLAHCKVLRTEISRACWAVSSEVPTEPQQVLFGPDAEYNAKHLVQLTFELLLIDAQDGTLIRGFQTDIPASGTPKQN